MMKIRTTFTLIGITFLVLTHLGDTYYRTWVYASQVTDFGLANYLPSITGTITAIFILIGLSKVSIKNAPISVLWVTLGCVLYEGLQPVLGTGVFDWQDLLAVVITGLSIATFLRSFDKSIVSDAT